MDWGDIERLASDFDLEVDTLRQVALPAVGFSPAVTADRAAATGSYFGGIPMLPDGMRWPIWSPTHYCQAERETARHYISQQPSTSRHWTSEIARLDELEAQGPVALTFLAQLDLDQLAEIAPIAPLPGTGKLLVFAEVHLGIACQGRADPAQPWGLIWLANEVKRSRTEPPSASEGLVRQPHIMVPSPIVTFPDTVMRDGVVVYEEYRNDDYAAFLSELDTVGVRGLNQVGGHVLRLQGGDIRATVSLRRHGYDAWSPPPADDSERLAAGCADWEFLFQFTDDYCGDFGWSGVASFWGGSPAIAAGDFRNTELHFEDT